MNKSISEPKYQIYYMFNCCFSVMTFFFTAIVDKGLGYEYMPLIPLLYFVFFVMGKDIHYYSIRYPGMLLLNVMMFLKYVVTVFFLAVNHNYELARYYKISVSESSYHIATLVILIEMCSIFTVISLFAHRFYSRDISNDNKTNTISKYQTINLGPVILLTYTICGIIIILNREEYLAKPMIIFSENTVLTEQIESTNSLSMVFHTFNILIAGHLINNCIVKFDDSHKLKYVIWAYIFISILIFLSISTSRINIVIPFILFMLITTRRFGKTGSALNAIAIGGLIGVFGIVSIYKNPWRYTEGSTTSGVLLEFAKGMQEYTSGILPTAAGLQAISYYKSSISISTLFNDVFGAVPGIAGWINQEDRLNYYYNLYALGGSSTSQIIPMSVTSYAYFSCIFSFVLVDIFIIVLFWVDSRTQRKRAHYSNYISEYQSLYLCFILGSAINSNLQMVTGRFFVNYLPPVLIIALNNLFVLRDKRKANNIRS